MSGERVPALLGLCRVGFLSVEVEGARSSLIGILLTRAVTLAWCQHVGHQGPWSEVEADRAASWMESGLLVYLELPGKCFFFGIWEGAGSSGPAWPLSRRVDLVEAQSPLEGEPQWMGLTVFCSVGGEWDLETDHS